MGPVAFIAENRMNVTCLRNKIFYYKRLEPESFRNIRIKDFCAIAKTLGITGLQP